MIKATINAWAVSYGHEARTIIRALAKCGMQVSARQEVSAMQIRDALFGDEYAAKLRGLQLDNEEKERQGQEACGQLIQLSEVEKLLSEKVVLPLRARLVSAPTTLDTQTNPTDPQLSREAIQRWVDETLTLLREKLK